MATRTFISLALALVPLPGCETRRALEESDELRQQGDLVRSVEVLQAEMKDNPDDVQLRTATFSKLELLVAHYSREANNALMRDAAGPMAGMNIPGMPKLF